MTHNIGSADRIIRLVAAALFAVLYFTGAVTGIVGIIMLVLAVTFTLTSFISFCPLYLPFGINTHLKTKTT